MPMLRFALVFTVLVPGAGMAETAVSMPAVGFRYTTQMHVDTTMAAGNSNSVLHREVVASDGTTMETRNEGTISGGDREFATSGKTTYRFFFLTDGETTAQPITDQPPMTTGTTWDCPADGLDKFYPRGTAAEVSVECKVSEKFKGQVMGPQSVTLNFSDLGPAQDTTLAGTFEVRRIVVRSGPTAGITTEMRYDFSPELGISVVQETKVSMPQRETVSRTELADFTPAP
jgi:hypothetical protein